MAKSAAKPKSGPTCCGINPLAAGRSRAGKAGRGANALAIRLDAALRKIGKALSRDEAAPCCEGLTPAQCRTLEVLCSCAGCTCTTLAEETGVSASTLTRHVDPLVSAGLVQRVEGGDRRVVCLCCTPSGQRVAAKISESRMQFLAGVLARIPDDRRNAVLCALEELIAAFNDSSGGTCC